MNLKKAKANKDLYRINFLYLTVLILIYIIGGIFKKNKYLGMFINEYIILFFLSFLYLNKFSKNKKRYLRLNKISMKEKIYTVWISIFLYPILVIINTYFILFLSKYTKTTQMVAPIPENRKMYFISIVIMGISPGICEEIFFRGVLFEEYEKVYGTIFTILFMSFLFSIFHLNIYNLIVPFILGIVFGILRSRSNSIFPAIIGHSINNITAITIGYFMEIGYFRKISLYLEKGGNKIKIYILGILFLVFSFFILKRLLGKYPKRNRRIIKGQNIKLRFSTFMPILIGIIMYIFINKKVYF